MNGSCVCAEGFIDLENYCYEEEDESFVESVDTFEASGLPIQGILLTSIAANPGSYLLQLNSF